VPLHVCKPAAKATSQGCRTEGYTVSTQMPMTAAVFIPPGVEYSAQVLVTLTPRQLLYDTHILLCNCSQKAGVSSVEGEEDSWDLYIY
jgi:hypothetical protein